MLIGNVIIGQVSSFVASQLLRQYMYTVVHTQKDD